MTPFKLVSWFSILPVLIASLLASAAHGQILLPDTVDPYSPIVASAEASDVKNATLQLAWRTDPGVQFIQSPDSKKLFIWAAPGDHWIELTVITQSYKEITVLIPDPSAPTDVSKSKLDKIKIYEAFTIKRFDKEFKVLGTVPPVPVPPKPIPDVDPTPTPTPVDPTPGPPDDPRPNISVMILFETDDFDEMPFEQVNAINSATVRAYLNTHCLKDKQGKPEWRAYDDDIDLSNEDTKWVDAHRQAMQSGVKPPLIAISNGTKGVVTPLPANQTALVKLLKEWGGP